MAISAHLLVDGIEGESKDANREKHIDVLSYSMGVSNPPSPLGGGFSKGKATPSDFNFMLAQGRSSVNLEQFVETGQHVENVVLKLSKSIGDVAGVQEYMTVTFKDCFISHHQESGSGGGDILDSVSITYSYKKTEYSEQKTAGGKLENAANAEWDFKSNSQTKSA
jgi:type VI secretion system secreted protein Hcp